MATFDELVLRIDVATQKLEGDVNDITGFATNLETAVTDAQTSADAAAASAAEAANKVPEAPIDGKQYARKDATWTEVSASATDVVKSVNGKTPDGAGAVTLTYTDVGALQNTYVPTWASITGRPSQFPTSWALVADKPTTFAPAAHTHDAGDVTSGTFSVLRIPNIPATKLTNAGGPIALDLIPVIPASKISGQAAATADQYLAGDGTWKTPEGGGGSAGGFAFTETGLNISGTPVTYWPHTNPNRPADLTDWGHTSGITQGQFFTSAVGIALLPDGDYVPGANSILTGQAIKGMLGVLRVRSINAEGTNKRAWFYPQPLGSDTRAVFYVYSNGKQNWIPVGLTSGAPN